MSWSVFRFSLSPINFVCTLSYFCCGVNAITSVVPNSLSYSTGWSFFHSAVSLSMGYRMCVSLIKSVTELHLIFSRTMIAVLPIHYSVFRSELILYLYYITYLDTLSIDFPLFCVIPQFMNLLAHIFALPLYKMTTEAHCKAIQCASLKRCIFFAYPSERTLRFFSGLM